MITDIAIVKCPFCKRITRVPRLYAPSLKGIKKIAVNHDDHFLIIGFDKYGVVRYYDVFKKIEFVRIGDNIKIACPLCGRSEFIDKNITFDRFSIDHGGHVLLVYKVGVVYKVGEKLEIEIINVVRQVYSVPRHNMIKKILRYISRKEFAYIIVEMIRNPNSDIIVPQNIYEDVKFVLKKIFGNASNIKVGYSKKTVNSIPLDFIESKISEVEDLSDEEAISLIQDTIELITSLKDSIVKIRKLYGINEACKYLFQLEKTNLSLFKLINDIVRIKC